MFSRRARPARAAASFALAGLAAVALTAVGDDVPRLTSRFVESGITIDGAGDDWPALTPFSTEPPVDAAFANDGVYLYAAFRTADPGARLQVLRQGLIVWFDARGGDKKRFGVHYPDTALPAKPQRGGGGGGRPPGGAPGEPSQDEGRWRRLEILGPDKDDVRSLMLDYTPAIEVAVGDDEGTLFYELKVPLRVTPETPYAIGATPGAEIGVGLETKKIETPDGPGGRGMFGLPGMRGGGMPGGGRNGGGRNGGEPPPKLEPMKLWARVSLASPNRN